MNVYSNIGCGAAGLSSRTRMERSSRCAPACWSLPWAAKLPPVGVQHVGSHGNEPGSCTQHPGAVFTWVWADTWQALPAGTPACCCTSILQHQLHDVILGSLRLMNRSRALQGTASASWGKCRPASILSTFAYHGFFCITQLWVPWCIPWASHSAAVRLQSYRTPCCALMNADCCSAV